MWNRSSLSDDDLSELWLTESPTGLPLETQPETQTSLSLETLLRNLNLSCLQPFLEERGIVEIDGLNYVEISKLNLPVGPKKRLLRAFELAISRSKRPSSIFEPGHRYSLLKQEVNSYLAELRSFHTRHSSGRSKIQTLVAKINQNHQVLNNCMASFRKRQRKYTSRRFNLRA